MDHFNNRKKGFCKKLCHVKGSSPPLKKGLHFKTLETERARAFQALYFLKAFKEYSEQVGENLQEGGNMGLIFFL